MNIAESFANYLEDTGVATLGEDLFIGEAPSSNVVADSIWWVVSTGGSPFLRLASGEMIKDYQIQVFHRDRNGKHVYDRIFDLEEGLNCAGCAQLEGFETVDIAALSFPIDNDLDDEDRKIGLLQANLRTYKRCLSGVS